MKSSAGEQLSQSTPEYSIFRGGVVGSRDLFRKKNKNMADQILLPLDIVFERFIFALVKFTNIIDNILYVYCFLLFFGTIYPTAHSRKDL